MAKWDPPHVISRVKFCLHAIRSVAPFFFLAKVPFLTFFNTERSVAI